MTSERDQETAHIAPPMNVLVTGAGARVGQAIAYTLAERGAHILVHFHTNREGAEKTADLVRMRGGRATCIQADLRSSRAIQSLTNTVIEMTQGQLDLLVNNASLFAPRPMDCLDLETWQEMLQVNLTAPFQIAQSLLEPLRSRQGLIINLCDISAERPLKTYAHYTTSKAGLIGLTRALAIELAPEIRCVGISPGQVAWPPEYTQEQREALTRRIPMQRSGSPEDVAGLVRFLLEEGRYLNGAIIPVDGGLSCRY